MVNSSCSRFFRVDAHCSSIDVKSQWYKDDPFVFPSQVQQVFYIADTKLGNNYRFVVEDPPIVTSLRRNDIEPAIIREEEDHSDEDEEDLMGDLDDEEKRKKIKVILMMILTVIYMYAYIWVTKYVVVWIQIIYSYFAGASSVKRRRVRGPTRGKRIRRIIVKNKGERILAYVTPEIRVFCGNNANKVASQVGTQIRWICPIMGFYPLWKSVDSTLKDAILQVVREKIKVTENEVESTELVEEVFHEKANLLYKDWKWRMDDFYAKTLCDSKGAYQHPFQETPTDDWKYMIDHVFKDPKRKVN
ncbi:uncharacterized protein LOC131328268 [Rhododendron vialii]|uniref:uncharacterized protein LOC131328268 n=1 Tax=Rhododendron vialii TaxID=182163 RepID=UPI00265F37D3|nr:uncharacterized protein LOC131328268 [Rhododendron vialii]